MKKAFCIVLTALMALHALAGIRLEKGSFSIVVPAGTDSQVMLAAKALQKDCAKVLSYTPSIVRQPAADGVSICVVEESNEAATGLLTRRLPLDDFESHRVYADAAGNRIFLHGKDMRGTIYAIYTFSEKVLGVPPLWYWCSWVPQKQDAIEVEDDIDYFYKSPRVRYRAWFPNDTDLFTPWLNKTSDHWDACLETMLRLKLNTMEMEGCVTWDKKGLNAQAMRLQTYGLVLTSHHHAPLATGFVMWDDYWKNVRGYTTPPELTLNDKESIYEFWQYSIDCIKAANIEYIWLIGFRGSGDHPFWESGDEGRKVNDAPSTDAERAAVINEMTQKQYDMVCASTGEENPFVRMTFYNELSDLMGKGLLTPPSASNVLWTYVAARRDHYPSVDLRNHSNPNVKVGLYFNFQFTSTGSHLAPAEGPWKMEYNFRYALSKAPLQFSVVNMGNFREYMMEASANAAFLWDYERYTTDNFLQRWCTQYYGAEFARPIAQLYHDYYYSFWNQHASDFQNMPRQYVFQDLRYKDAFAAVKNNFGNGKINIFDDARLNIGNHDNELNDLVSGMQQSAKGFREVLERAEDIRPQLAPEHRQFFYDNFVQYARFMAGLSNGLWHYATASLSTDDRAGHGALAIGSYTNAVHALFNAQHDEFASWINDVSGAKFGLGNTYKQITAKTPLDSCTLVEAETATLLNNAQGTAMSVVEVDGCSGGKAVTGVGNGNAVQIRSRQRKACVCDLLIIYTATTEDRWIDIDVNGTVYHRLAPRAGSVRSFSDTRGFLTVTIPLQKNTNTIQIGNASGPAPDLDAFYLTSSPCASMDSTQFDVIQPDDDWLYDGNQTITGLHAVLPAPFTPRSGIYNLLGQRLSADGHLFSSLNAGLYIVNGKKTCKR